MTTQRAERAGPTLALADTAGSTPKAVVAVGASAGGLDALRRFLSGVSADLDAAIVIAQHLSPNHASALTELLGKGSPLPVEWATHGVELVRGVVYVTPTDHDVRYLDGKLELIPPQAVGPKPNIDRLFDSLAEAQGTRSIAVVLSGTGSDGTAGLLELRRVGGLTLVQDPVTCQFDGMPRSAIEAGAADLVLPAEAMGDALRNAIEFGDRGDSEPSESDLDAVIEAAERATGIRLTQYKVATIARRIDRRMRLRRTPTYDAYLQLLQHDPGEAFELGKDVFISVTEFFRDLDAFEVLRGRLRDRFADPPAGGLRIWVAGCSTGQEAYSIAMVCEDLRTELHGGARYQIFASDISTRAIECARRASYGNEIPEQVPAELVNRYFVRDGDRYLVKPVIRDRILFSVHDLAKDPPFAHLHLVSCRNVLIYFDQALQDRTIASFQFALEEGGLLFLGTSESASRYPKWFAADVARSQLYHRVAGVTRAHPNPYRPPAPKAPVVRPKDGGVRAVDGRERAMWSRLLELRVDAALLVNDRNEVVHTFGRADEVTRLSRGGVSLDLLDLIDEDLRAPLRTLMFKAKREGSASFVALRGVRGNAVERERVRLEVHTVTDGTEGALLVTIDRSPVDSVPVDAEMATAPSDDAIVHALEVELAGTRANLQALVEELETTNEELMAANEEMQSSNEEMLATNEEMQTTNEELQSASEELRTLNDELETRNVELHRLSLDVQNIERGVDLPLLVLSSDLRVRRASATLSHIADIDGLVAGDPLAAVAWHGPVGTELADAARLAIANGRTQRVVVSLGEATFEARVAAYATFDGERIGAVMTFFDVSERARSLQRVLEERQLAWSTLAALGEAVITTDAHGVIEYANDAAAHLTGRTTLDLVGRSFDEVVQLSADGGRTRLPSLAIDTLRSGEAMRSITPLIATTGDVRRVVDFATHVLANAEGVPEGVVVVLRDVSERERLVAEVERRGNYDALTETLNRAAFERELERALEGIKAHGETHVLLYLDLDRFKIINDTSGHAAGDQVLRDMARLVKRAVRVRDAFGRLGGDEFGVVVRNCTLAEGEAFAARLVRGMQEYALTWGDRRYTVSLSVGAVLLDRDGCDTIIDAMSNADIALYEAKGRGGNGVYVFRSDDATRATRKEFSAVNDLTAALHDDHLVLYGQLITSARSRRPVGVEVLARIRAPNDRIMQPAEFLPAAERFGIVRRLDRAVIAKALAQLQVAAAADPRARALNLHVNVSALTLSDIDFLGFVRDQAGDADAPLGSIVFEVTESATITDLAAAASFVSGVRVLGAKLALDDFGRGASSFEHLRSLAPEIVKIDGQFVTGCAHDAVSKAIIRATVEIASFSGMCVVAEHVESEEDAATLLDLGVDAFQGYLLGRPAPLTEVFAAALREVPEVVADCAAQHCSNVMVAADSLPQAKA